MNEGLFAHIDFYCERTGPEFWSEPVNALTNLAFIAAGLFGIAAVRRRGTDAASEVLCWWVLLIGIGSTIFHTFATELTKWADILPIASFTLAFSLFCLRRFLGRKWPSALAVFFGFYVVSGVATALVPTWLRVASNGSTGYLPALLAMLFFSALLIGKGHPAARYTATAGIIFFASMICRMVDPMVCDRFPLGTHFLWHVLNGLMLAVLLAAVARFGAPNRDAARQAGRAGPGR